MEISLTIRKTLLYTNSCNSRLFNVLLEFIERKTRLCVMILLRKTFELIICSGILVQFSLVSTLYYGGFFFYNVWIFFYAVYKTVQPALLNSSESIMLV